MVNRLERLTSFPEIARVAKVPIDTKTRRDVVLCHAERVWTALQFTAGVHAFANVSTDLEADLFGGTVEIVGTVFVLRAAFFEVVRVAGVSGRADTVPVLAD